MGTHREVISELKEPTRSLRAASPEVWAGFGAMHQAAAADGALPAKVKELMALRGATADEVAEALVVALLMDGGTASVYGPRAWAAFEEFAPLATSSVP
ncbi:MAG: hypothetical protein LH624_17545 [Cryobacterium sp.]|nr:hypothetical protein [Cryobacterium sp.]